MNKILFSSKSVVWETPQTFFDNYNAVYNFTTDVCALPENAKCSHFYTPEIDGLKQTWSGACWMNPPYGREIYQWIKKASDESHKGATVVALLPVRTDTKWFHDYIYQKQNTAIEFLKGRLKFGGSINSAPFPSMVVVFKPKD
jgi:phage N-6-adenine-methyltransferase